MGEHHKKLEELPMSSCGCSHGGCCENSRPQKQKTHFIKKYLGMKLLELAVATVVIAVLQPEKFKELRKSVKDKLPN